MSSLAALGFYGTQRYLVTARRGEYAVRSALGADPQSLARLVITRAFVAGLPGLVVGSVPAFAATAWLRSEFLSSAVSAETVPALVAIGLACLLTLASLDSARQARSTAPAELLRE